MLWMLSILLSIFFSCMQAETPTVPEIHSEMEKIFSEHLSQKKLNGVVMQRAIIYFINQFDPHHVYLTREDVKPYLTLSKSALNQLADEVQKQDYSIFKKINSTFQAAIRKMRKFRRGLVVDREKFSEWSKEPLTVIPESKQGDVDSFVKTEQELQVRHSIFMAHLVQRELESLKELNLPVSFLASVRNAELELEEEENNYLYLNKLGKPLGEKEEEEMFAFHVLRALTASLDVHSEFLSSQEAERMRMRLEKAYTGVGIEVVEQGGAFVVSEIIKGSSADKSGKIEIGDELTSIDQTKLNALSLDEVDSLLQGKVGSYADLAFAGRGKKPFHVVLEREVGVLSAGRVDTTFEKIDSGIVGVITLHAFYQGAASSDEDVKKAIDELKKKGKLEGLVLDLRDNRGGFLMQAVKVAGEFITTGIIVAAKYSDGSIHYFRDLDPSVLYQGPLVVLTSKETASAAEIVAQALKDYGVGIIVGDERTYGKGSIQMQTVTEGKEKEGYFKVTIGRYYGVSGHSTQLEGVKADIVVPSYLAEKKVGEEYLYQTMKPDTIPPSFNDTLSDVPPQEKPWYEKHYLPYLQKPTDKWRIYIPELAKRSKMRLEKNKNYQSLLQGKGVIYEQHGLTEEAVSLDPEAAERTLGNMQLQEAIDITKDLIQLSH